MATFSNRDKEVLSDARNLLREKVTTLGADGYDFSEPFARENIIPLSRTLRVTPDGYNSNLGLVTPNYDDYPVEGAVGTRRVEMRLHSYLPSGLTGPDSCQTFIAVSGTPASNHVDDIESVMLRPLISSSFSPRKTNAANSDTYLRGFELALYPAKMSSTPGILDADTSNGPISPVADPGAASSSNAGAGANSEGFWYVDYENGVVRFSRPPLNGSTGVMNPNNIFGDLNGNTGSGDGYAITMFATFYYYTGEVGFEDDPDIVTVGDGYVSTGEFVGANNNAVQAAINSLPDEGGTVFIKEGQYDFTSPVTVPTHVHVVGIGGTRITRPRREPAFAIMDGYSSVEGMEIQPRDGLTFGGAIEIRTVSNPLNNIVNDIKIKNNVIHVEDDAYGVSFAPILTSPSYRTIEISDNSFVSDNSKANSVAIGETLRGQTADIGYLTIKNNNFQLGDTTSSPVALMVRGEVLQTVSNLIFRDNFLNRADININPSIATGGSPGSATDLVITGNSSYAISGSGSNGSVYIENEVSGQTTTDLIISNNSFETITTGNLTNAVISDNSFSNDCVLGGTGQYVAVADNIIADDLIIGITGSNETWTGCTVVGNSVVGSLVSFSVLEDSTISSNKFGDVTISPDGTSAGTGVFYKSVFSSNSILGSTAIGYTGSDGTAIVLYNSTISNNMMQGGFTVSTLLANSSTMMFQSSVTDNTITGAMVFDMQNSSSTGVVVQDSNISGNTTTDDIRIDHEGATGTAILRSAIDSNYCGNQIELALTPSVADDIVALDESTFSGNTADSSIRFGTSSKNKDLVICNESSIAGNTSGSDFIFYGKIFECTVSGNTTNDDFTLSSLNYSTFSNNWGDGCYITAPGTEKAIDNSVIADNTFINDFDVTNWTGGDNTSDCVVSSVITGNYMGDYASFGYDVDTTEARNAVIDTIISNNFITNYVQFGSATRDPAAETCIGLTFANNIITGATLDFYGAIRGCTISNTAAPSATFTTNAVYDSSIKDGYFSSCAIAAELTSGTGVADSVIDNNRILGNFTVGASIASGVVIESSIVSNNTIDTGSIAIGGSVTGTTSSLVLNKSMVINNSHFGATNITMGNSSRNEVTNTYVDSVIDGNSFCDSISDDVNIYGKFLESSVSGNHIKGDIFIYGSMDESVFNDNRVGRDVTVGDNILAGEGTVLNSNIISGNSIGNNFFVAPDFTGGTAGKVMDNSLISDNIIVGATTIGNSGRTVSTLTYSKSIISSNKSGDGSNLSIYGKFEDCVVSNNFSGSSFIIDDVETSVISGNYVTGTFNGGTFTDVVLVGNYAPSTSGITDSIYMHAPEGVFTKLTGTAITPTTAADLAARHAQNCVLAGGLFVAVGGTGNLTLKENHWNIDGDGYYEGSTGRYVILLDEAIHYHSQLQVSHFTSAGITAQAAWIGGKYIRLYFYNTAGAATNLSATDHIYFNAFGRPAEIP
jgi:hypothetical protein